MNGEGLALSTSDRGRARRIARAVACPRFGADPFSECDLDDDLDVVLEVHSERSAFALAHYVAADNRQRREGAAARRAHQAEAKLLRARKALLAIADALGDA
ncbi:hypothetical protein AXH82_01845 [Microbacterium sp. PAMC 28756]|uniref:hypothetical protein n=1 Tax=Microbacterium sp. PAMC 28756 TaxID=1795053 RepID=UPI00076B4711|nr:hypothetical protein [Microbacterium sp. PAMC 28756]AMG82256.1 hypothetical protein AXH82_01845 [Microbacterium sp. PAMC 28756]